MTNKLKTFHGLTSIPFSKCIGTTNLFEGASQTEMIVRLEMALSMDDLALVTGTSGTGKSSALRKFVETLDPATHPFAYITAERFRIGELCKQILLGLKITPPFSGYAALTKLKKEIETRYSEKNSKPVIVIDEAQELPPETLLSLKNLTNFEMDSRPKLLIILSGHNELASTLGMYRYESLSRRIRIRCKIEPLSLEETSRYLESQLANCGSRKSIFAQESIARIFSATQGNISQINNLCLNALIFAAAESQPIVGPAIIDKVLGGM